jgi:hypothetical protein
MLMLILIRSRLRANGESAEHNKGEHTMMHSCSRYLRAAVAATATLLILNLTPTYAAAAPRSTTAATVAEGLSPQADAASAAPIWSAPLDIFAGVPDCGCTSDSLQLVPVFDPQGNAYLPALVWDGSDTQFYLSKVLAGGGVSAPQIQFALGGPNPGNLWQLLSDRKGNLVFLAEFYANDGTRSMKAWRYEPASGWQAPVTIYSGLSNAGVNYGNMAAADDQGNIVLVIHGQGAPAYFYSASAKTWQPIAAPIGTTTAPIFGVKLVSNASGDAIYLVYNQEFVSGFPYGSIYVRRFNAANLSWEARRRVPGIGAAVASTAAAVDGQGVLSVLFSADSAQHTLSATRLQYGIWSRPTVVLDVTGSPAPVHLGPAVANAANHVLAAVTAVNSSATARAYAVRWNGSQWLTETVANVLATNADRFYQMSAYPAWAGGGDAAVIGFSLGGYSSASYSDGINGWSAASMPAALAQDSFGFFSLSSSPLGMPLAIYRAATGPANPSGASILGSWLLN